MKGWNQLLGYSGMQDLSQVLEPPMELNTGLQAILRGGIKHRPDTCGRVLRVQVDQDVYPAKLFTTRERNEKSFLAMGGK